MEILNSSINDNQSPKSDVLIETKREPLMLGIEMNNVNLDEYKPVIYKHLLSGISIDSLTGIGSMFRIARNHQWADTVWNMANVSVTNRSNQQQIMLLKDLVKQGNFDLYSSVELKLPSLKVIFTDGYRQYSVICSVTSKLGLIDQWMKNSEESIWFRKSLVSGNLLYYEVPTTFVKTLKQLSMNQIIFDLYGPNIVYIYVRTKDSSLKSISNCFENCEQELLNSIKQLPRRKDSNILKNVLTKELRNSLPKCLDIYDNTNPLIYYDETINSMMNWDIMICDSRQSFRFNNKLLPNAAVAVIDCQSNITLEMLVDIEKQYSKTVKRNNTIQCLISYQQILDEKSLIFERIMGIQDNIGLDLILMLGIGAFIRLTNSGKFIYLKEPGSCLQSLYTLIGQHITQYSSSNIVEYTGLIA